MAVNYNLVYKNRNDDLVYSWTKFQEIYKLFLNHISNDYRIKKMFNENKDVAEDMLQTWLVKAIVMFPDCLQDLENNFNEGKKTFTVGLTLTEKVILADLMVLVWMEWNINNITQMNLSLQDSDFNRHAESQNLSGKVEYANKWREQVYHKMSEYTQKDIPISQWATGEIL